MNIRWWRSRGIHLVIQFHSWGGGVYGGSSGLAVLFTDLFSAATENTGWYTKQHQQTQKRTCIRSLMTIYRETETENERGRHKNI